MFKSQQYPARTAECGVKGWAVSDDSRRFSTIAAAPHLKRKDDAACGPSQVTHRDASSASALSRWDNEGGAVRDEPSM
jgi:hypothetical protein